MVEIQNYIETMKDFQSLFIAFIENESNFNDLTNFIKTNDIFANQSIMLDTFQTIMEIANNHHREPFFFQKIAQFIGFYLSDIKFHLSNLEIFNIFKENKLLLLHLFLNKIIIFDEPIKNLLLSVSHYNQILLRHFLYSEIKAYLDLETREKIEKEICQIFGENLDLFIQNCHSGENDLYVCSLIRQDLIKEFIIYINKTDISIKTSFIQQSIFETNSFLINRPTTLIQYTAFFGSIEIFNYLKLNGAVIDEYLWEFAVHGRNPEIIYILEENDSKAYQRSFIESVKCHHNNFAQYFHGILLDLNLPIPSTSLSTYNFAFMPDYLDIFRYKSSEKKSVYFKYCSSLKTTTFPSHVSMIAYNAFKFFVSLTQIMIPSSVTEINSKAFQGCSSLEEISIPSSVSAIKQSTFEQCSSLKKVTIPSSVTRIDKCAFKNCSSIQQLSISSSVNFIGKAAFKGCSSLIQITIPNSIKKIESELFRGCTSLIEFSIPSSITSIDYYAFAKCTSLAQITIPPSVSMISKGAFCNCSSLTQIIIPSSIKSICDCAFHSCSSLMQVFFETPSCTSSIGNYSFANCIALKQIEVPSSVTSIGKYAFANCRSLEQIQLSSSSLKEIDDNIFEECELLKQVSIPSSVENINRCAFRKCSALMQIKIPPSVTSIHYRAFSECVKLEEVFIPSSVTFIGVKAFENCSSLKTISFQSPYYLISIKKLALPSFLTIKYK